MPEVTIYTRSMCGYCTRAIDLLKRKGVPLKVIDATFDTSKRDEMISRSGRFTFPQIFIGETHVGGCDDLQALDRGGKLDPMLQGG